MKYAYAEDIHVLPLLAPQDIVATATASAYLDCDNVTGVFELSIPFGNIASTDSTGEVVVTIEASTAGSSNATETPIAFKYRLSAAINTDTMGALTAATASGAAVVSDQDNKVLMCFVDPSTLAALGNDFRFIRAVITPTAEITATVIGGCTARFRPRYAGSVPPSST